MEVVNKVRITNNYQNVHIGEPSTYNKLERHFFRHGRRTAPKFGTHVRIETRLALTQTNFDPPHSNRNPFESVTAVLAGRPLFVDRSTMHRLHTRRHCSIAPAFRYKSARWQPLTTQHSIINIRLCRRIRHTAQRVKQYGHTVNIRLTDKTIIITSWTINTFITIQRGAVVQW